MVIQMGMGPSLCICVNVSLTHTIVGFRYSLNEQLSMRHRDVKTPIGSNVFLHVARLRLVTRMRASNLPNTKVFSNQVTLKENVKGSFTLRRSERECDIAFRWQFNMKRNFRVRFRLVQMDPKAISLETGYTTTFFRVIALSLGLKGELSLYEAMFTFTRREHTFRFWRWGSLWTSL